MRRLQIEVRDFFQNEGRLGVDYLPGVRLEKLRKSAGFRTAQASRGGLVFHEIGGFFVMVGSPVFRNEAGFAVCVTTDPKLWGLL